MEYSLLAHRILINAPEIDEGIKNWKGIFQSNSWALQVLDRRGLVKMPYTLALLPQHQMPTDLSNPLTYEQCCDKRAAELVALSKQKHKPLVLLWSGGIDSTCALVSLLKQGADKETLRIMLDQNSIDENPNFYERFLHYNFIFAPSSDYNLTLNDDFIFLTGELNDQLMGYNYTIPSPQLVQKIHDPWDAKEVDKWLTRMGMIDNTARRKWLELMIYSATNAPIPITTNFLFFWWINFCFKWQYIALRFLLAQTTQDAARLVENGQYQTFFNTEDFQRWSMTVDPRVKYKQDWTDYKEPSKRIIYEFDEDLEDYKNKVKKGSPLIEEKRPRAGLSIELSLYDDNEIDIEQLYNPNHSFL